MIAQAKLLDDDERLGNATSRSLLQRKPRLHLRRGRPHIVTILRRSRCSASHEAVPLIARSKTTNTSAEA